MLLDSQTKISKFNTTPFSAPRAVLNFLLLVCNLVHVIKDYSTLGVRYRDLQARVYKQGTRNLTLYEAKPSAVLNFVSLVCKRVLVNLITREQRVLQTF